VSFLREAAREEANKADLIEIASEASERRARASEKRAQEAAESSAADLQSERQRHASDVSKLKKTLQEAEAAVKAEVGVLSQRVPPSPRVMSG